MILENKKLIKKMQKRKFCICVKICHYYKKNSTKLKKSQVKWKQTYALAKHSTVFMEQMMTQLAGLF